MNSSLRLTHRTLCLVALGLSALVPASAMPPRQHLITGVVQSFDPPTRTLTVAPSRADLPASVVVKEGRTRLREDGKAATLQQLPASGPVRIYYRTELGQRVATEISWRSTAK
jgi:hypothetical protein